MATFSRFVAASDHNNFEFPSLENWSQTVQKCYRAPTLHISMPAGASHVATQLVTNVGGSWVVASRCFPLPRVVLGRIHLSTSGYQGPLQSGLMFIVWHKVPFLMTTLTLHPRPDYGALFKGHRVEAALCPNLSIPQM